MALTKWQRRALQESAENGGSIGEHVLRIPGNQRGYMLQRLQKRGLLAFVGTDFSGTKVWKLTPEGWASSRQG